MKPTPRKSIFSHLELGDALVVNGLVRTLAKGKAPVDLFTGMNSWQFVRRMYSDLPNVHVWWLTNYEEFKWRWADKIPNQLALGYFAPVRSLFDPGKWDAEMYRIAGIPFDAKWTAFNLPPELLGPQPQMNRCAIVHQDYERNFRIDSRRLPHDIGIVEIFRRNSVWDWLAEIRAAEQIHVIDSVFLNMADLLWFKGWLCAKRLVYHKYARTAPPPVLRGPWEILT